MANHRSLDSDFWVNPRIRRYPWHCRILLAGLITCIADDEGRFDADPSGLLDTLFSRNDPVKVADIAADLQLLIGDQTVVLYGEGCRFGFLVAWYRRQVIDRRLRRPSTRPAPPVSDIAPVTSWAFANLLADARAAGERRSKAWTAVTCREYSALPESQRDEIRKQLIGNGEAPFIPDNIEEEPILSGDNREEQSFSGENRKEPILSGDNREEQSFSGENRKEPSDGDGDGDGDKGNVPDSERARTRAAFRGAAAPRAQSGNGSESEPLAHRERGGNGKSAAPPAQPPRDPDAPWVAMHGPPPKAGDERDFYLAARKLWRQGHPGPFSSYHFPQEPYDDGTGAAT